MTNLPPSDFLSHFDELKRRRAEERAEQVKQALLRKQAEEGKREYALRRIQAVIEAAQEFSQRARDAGVSAQRMTVWVGYEKGLLGNRKRYDEITGWKILEPVNPTRHQYYDDENGKNVGWWSDPLPGAYVIEDGRLMYGYPPKLLVIPNELINLDQLDQRGSLDYPDFNFPKKLAEHLFKLNPNA